MTGSGARSRCTVLTGAVVLGLTVALVGCASLGPATPVAVSDLGSVAGTWKGVVYGPGSEPEYVELTIGEGNSTADTASPGSAWLADAFRPIQ